MIRRFPESGFGASVDIADGAVVTCQTVLIVLWLLGHGGEQKLKALMRSGKIISAECSGHGRLIFALGVGHVRRIR